LTHKDLRRQKTTNPTCHNWLRQLLSIAGKHCLHRFLQRFAANCTGFCSALVVVIGHLQLMLLSDASGIADPGTNDVKRIVGRFSAPPAHQCADMHGRGHSAGVGESINVAGGTAEQSGYCLHVE